MPIIPPVSNAPYDTADYVLNMARTFVNDAAQNLGGNLLADSRPYTFVYLNSAWRTLQDVLMNAGVEVFPAEVVISAVPAVTSTDPASQQWMGYDNFFDGTNALNAPTLPADLVIPLKLMERQNGTQSVFKPMFPVNDGLPSRPKVPWLQQYDWRDNAIYLVGATVLTDIRLRYNRYLPDIQPDTQGLGTTRIPLPRCAKALAYYIAAEYATSRGSPLADGFTAKGDNAAGQMISRTVRKQQRGNHRRQPYSARNRNSWGWY